MQVRALSTVDGRDGAGTVALMLVCEPALLQRAADVAAADLGLGAPELLRRSSAAAFLAGQGFLRVVGFADDPAGTMAVARVVADSLGGARPLTADPIEVDCGEVCLYVEPYERLVSTTLEPVSFRELGERLAALHAIEVAGVGLRSLRRVDACRERLALAPESAQVRLGPLVAQLAEELDADTATQGLCHGDPSRGNLMATTGGTFWVDFEYSGIGPIGHDVAFCLVELLRFRGPQAAREFAAGYETAGGNIDTLDVLRLGRVRDVYGVVDYSYQTDPGHRAEFARRLASFDEPFRRTTWGVPIPS